MKTNHIGGPVWEVGPIEHWSDHQAEEGSQQKFDWYMI